MTSKLALLGIALTLVLSGVALSLWILPPISGAQSVTTSDVTSGTDSSYTTIYINVSDSGSGNDGVSTSGVVTTTVYSLSFATITLPAKTFTETELVPTTITSTQTVTTSEVTTITVTEPAVTISSVHKTPSVAISCSNCESISSDFTPHFFYNVTEFAGSSARSIYGWANSTDIQLDLGTTSALWEVTSTTPNAQFTVTIGGVNEAVGLVPTTFPLPNGTLVAGYGDSGIYS